MLGRVGQAFPHDPVRGAPDGGRQPRRLAVHGQVDGEPGGGRVTDEPGDVEVLRPLRRAVVLLAEDADDLAEALHRCRRSAPDVLGGPPVLIVQAGR